MMRSSSCFVVPANGKRFEVLWTPNTIEQISSPFWRSLIGLLLRRSWVQIPVLDHPVQCSLVYMYMSCSPTRRQVLIYSCSLHPVTMVCLWWFCLCVFLRISWPPLPATHISIVFSVMVMWLPTRHFLRGVSTDSEFNQALLSIQ